MCDREKLQQTILIGKTFYKSIAIPSLLYGTNIINLTDDNIRKLQKIDNSVYIYASHEQHTTIQNASLKNSDKWKNTLYTRYSKKHK